MRLTFVCPAFSRSHRNPARTLQSNLIHRWPQEDRDNPQVQGLWKHLTSGPRDCSPICLFSLSLCCLFLSSHWEHPKVSDRPCLRQLQPIVSLGFMSSNSISVSIAWQHEKQENGPHNTFLFLSFNEYVILPTMPSSSTAKCEAVGRFWFRWLVLHFCFSRYSPAIFQDQNPTNSIHRRQREELNGTPSSVDIFTASKATVYPGTHDETVNNIIRSNWQSTPFSICHNSGCDSKTGSHMNNSQLSHSPRDRPVTTAKMYNCVRQHRSGTEG